MAMTNPMNSAATAAVNLADDGEAEVRLNYAEVDAIYEAARDAHLKATKDTPPRAEKYSDEEVECLLAEGKPPLQPNRIKDTP